MKTIDWSEGRMDVKDFKTDVKHAINEVAEKYKNVALPLQKLVYSEGMNQGATKAFKIIERLNMQDPNNLDDITKVLLDVLTQNRPYRAFDACKVARALAEHERGSVYMGIKERWEVTNAYIASYDLKDEFNIENEVPTYCQMYSTWATPVLKIRTVFGDEIEIEVWREMSDKEVRGEELDPRTFLSEVKMWLPVHQRAVKKHFEKIIK